jgi:two-component system nitrate/nitrite response regulator NarL
VTTGGGGARVLVVDDHPVFRRGLSMILRSEPWVSEVQEVATAAAAPREAVLCQADLVVMDLRLGDGDGVEATGLVRTARPDAVVVVLTMVSDADEVSRALAAGAGGYLLKTSPPEEICAALELARRGGLVLGPGLGAALLRPRTADRLPAPFDRLTPAELELARHLANGESNARIARALRVTDKTVRNRVSSLLVRLEVPDRVAAVISARLAGIDRPERC